MKLLLLSISLFGMQQTTTLPQEKQKADTVKKVIKPKAAKATPPMYPWFIIGNTF